MPDVPKHVSGSDNLRFGLRLLLGLSRLGTEHVVISPGSRSTPLTLAAALLSKASKLRTHVFLDERAAGFFACGLSKSSGKPALLICTSGTAGANYYPAAAECRMTSTPLIIITADRPPELRGKMAPQTMDQHNLYGRFSLLFEETAPEFYRHEEPDMVHQLAGRLYSTSLSAGPVHLNAGFRKPLEPEQAEAESLLKEVLKESQNQAMPVFMKHDLKPACDALDTVLQRLSETEHPVVISGPLNALSGAERALLEITSRSGGIPHLCEATSGIHHKKTPALIGGYESFLRNPDQISRLKPDFILRVGQPPVSKALNNFLVHHKQSEQWCFASTPEPPDPEDLCARHFRLPPVREIPVSDYEKHKIQTKDEFWINEWRSAAKLYNQKLHGLFRNTENNRVLTDGYAVFRVMAFIRENHPAEHGLFTGNSFSVRDIELFSDGPVPFRNVMHNRGVSGIDGIVSTAHGWSVSENVPAWVFLGDLSFLHDSNSLLHLSSHTGKPIVIVVFNNNGGTIFRMLPVASHTEHYRTYFETPQQADISALCRAHGIEARRCSTSGELDQILNDASFLNRPVTVLELTTDAAQSMKEREALWNTEA